MDRIKLSEKIGYALGDAATLMLVARLFDVVTDPVLTMIWALFSLIPAGIAAIMLLLTYLYPIGK